MKILVCDGCGAHSFQDGQELPDGWSEWTALEKRPGRYHACSVACWNAVSSGGRGEVADTIRSRLSSGGAAEALDLFRPALLEWVRALHEYTSASRARAAAYAADSGNVTRAGAKHRHEMQQREAAALARATAARERAEALAAAAVRDAGRR